MEARVTFLLASLLILVGCTTTSELEIAERFKPNSALDVDSHFTMVGKWYSDRPMDGGGRREQLVERYPDGTYHSHFRLHAEDGTVENQVEVGDWGVSGDIYFTIFRGWIRDEQFRPSNPLDPYNRDAYRILSLTETEFVYESVVSGQQYSISKVDPDFEL